MRVLVNRSKSVSALGEKDWVNAQANPPPEDGTGRMKLVINSQQLANKKFVKSKYLFNVIEFYKKIENLMQKIEHFENVKIMEAALLYNKGALCEQMAHKDYEPIPENT